MARGTLPTDRKIPRHAARLADVIQWWAYVAVCQARELWNALPGPWWVKILLIAVTQAIPGPQDEILLIAITAACRRWRARHTAI